MFWPNTAASIPAGNGSSSAFAGLPGVTWDSAWVMSSFKREMCVGGIIFLITTQPSSRRALTMSDVEAFAFKCEKSAL